VGWIGQTAGLIPEVCTQNRLGSHGGRGTPENGRGSPPRRSFALLCEGQWRRCG